MGVGIAIDVTNKAVILSDCSLGGKCRYCGESLCVGCSNMPVFIEKGEIVCPLCRIKKDVKVPDHARIFTHAQDYRGIFKDDDDE